MTVATKTNGGKAATPTSTGNRTLGQIASTMRTQHKRAVRLHTQLAKFLNTEYMEEFSGILREFGQCEADLEAWRANQGAKAPAGKGGAPPG